MNAILLLTILSLTMPIFGEEAQVKRRDKRGILGLSQGFEGSGLHENSLAVGTGYGQNYLGGASLGDDVSAPAYSHSYNTPLYSSHRLDYSRGLGYGGLGHSGPGYSSGGLGYAATRLGYGATGFGYGATGFGYGAAGFGYGAAGLGSNAAGLGYNAARQGYNAARQGYNAAGYDTGLGYSTGLNTGYRHG